MARGKNPCAARLLDAVDDLHFALEYGAAGDWEAAVNYLHSSKELLEEAQLACGVDFSDEVSLIEEALDYISERTERAEEESHPMYRIPLHWNTKPYVSEAYRKLWRLVEEIPPSLSVKLE